MFTLLIQVLELRLSADSSNIILVQDEGEDIVIEEVNFASVSMQIRNFRMTAMSLIKKRQLQL